MRKWNYDGFSDEERQLIFGEALRIQYEREKGVVLPPVPIRPYKKPDDSTYSLEDLKNIAKEIEMPLNILEQAISKHAISVLDGKYLNHDYRKQEKSASLRDRILETMFYLAAGMATCGIVVLAITGRAHELTPPDSAKRDSLQQRATSNYQPPFRAGYPLSKEELERGAYFLPLPQPVTLNSGLEQKIAGYDGFDHKISEVVNDGYVIGFKVSPLVYGAGNSCMNYRIIALTGQEDPNSYPACKEIGRN